MVRDVGLRRRSARDARGCAAWRIDDVTVIARYSRLGDVHLLELQVGDEILLGTYSESWTHDVVVGRLPARASQLNLGTLELEGATSTYLVAVQVGWPETPIVISPR